MPIKLSEILRLQAPMHRAAASALVQRGVASLADVPRLRAVSPKPFLCVRNLLWTSTKIQQQQQAPAGFTPGSRPSPPREKDRSPAFITDVDAFDDDVEQANIDRADQKFRNRQAKKGDSALLSDTAFDDDVELLNIDKADDKARHRKQVKEQEGMQVADLSDHDTLDDPVELSNMEIAEEKKRNRDAAPKVYPNPFD